MTGLEVANLSYHFGGKHALDNVTFSLEQGDFCALLGPNGAGKSTLFNLLTRLFVAPNGQIKIAGHDLQSATRAALATLGVVFQQTTLDLDLTVLQNLRYFAALHGISGRDRDLRIAKVLDRMQIADRAGEKARTLNGGHKRRTEIARALLHDPKVLLLDEPTVGLDAAARLAITEHVHNLSDDGTTILWATHLADEVWADDRLIILHQARILEDGIAKDIRGADSLESYFLKVTA
jgi:ABC-2 type transport system ATP-binding protein